jgi:hypothetical protein
MLWVGHGILQVWSIRFLSGLTITQLSADKGSFFLNADGMGSNKEQMIISLLVAGTGKFVGITCVFLERLVSIHYKKEEGCEMKLWRWAFLSSVILLLGLWLGVKAQDPRVYCLAKFGSDPFAACPLGCVCDMRFPPRNGYCCGTIEVHGVPHCCVYSHAQEIYPCFYESTLVSCGYAACGYCGDLTLATPGECNTNYLDPGYASCMEWAQAD